MRDFNMVKKIGKNIIFTDILFLILMVLPSVRKQNSVFAGKTGKYGNRYTECTQYDEKNGRRMHLWPAAGHVSHGITFCKKCGGLTVARKNAGIIACVFETVGRKNYDRY